MFKRTALEVIETGLKTKPVTVITGARQVGKTFICNLLAKKYGMKYVTLSDRIERKEAMRDPDGFLKSHGTPLIIDEIQKVPELFESIESIVDEKKLDNRANGLYVLTGSQTYRLMNGITQSMSGRATIIRLPTLTQSEISGCEERIFSFDEEKFGKMRNVAKGDVADVYGRIIRGCFPEIRAYDDIDHTTFYSDYVDTYISKDVSEMATIEDKNKFLDFMQILASLTGQQLNYEDLSRNTGVTRKTIDRWISILEAADIIFRLQPYIPTSTIKRVTRHPKLYFRDTGLACYLARVNQAETLMNSYLKGPMAETYIINEIMKTYDNRRINASFYYYRDSNNNEVDLLIEKDGRIDLVECKGSIECNKSDVATMKYLKQSIGNIGSMCLICMTEKPYVVDGVHAIPVNFI